MRTKIDGPNETMRLSGAKRGKEKAAAGKGLSRGKKGMNRLPYRRLDKKGEMQKGEERGIM